MMAEKNKMGKSKKEDSSGDVESIACNICGDGNREYCLLLCDVCDGGFHSDCLGLRDVPSESDPFFCTRCARQRDFALLSDYDQFPLLALDSTFEQAEDDWARKTAVARVISDVCIGYSDCSSFQRIEQLDGREALLFRMHPQPAGARLQQVLLYVGDQIARKLRVKNAAAGEQSIFLKPFFDDQREEWEAFLTLRGFIKKSNNSFSTTDKKTLETLFSTKRGWKHSTLQKTFAQTDAEKAYLEKNPQPASLKNVAFVYLSESTPFRILFSFQLMSVKFYYQAYDFRGLPVNRPGSTKKRGKICKKPDTTSGVVPLATPTSTALATATSTFTTPVVPTSAAPVVPTFTAPAVPTFTISTTTNFRPTPAAPVVPTFTAPAVPTFTTSNTTNFRPTSFRRL
jgi:hypothetical protein